MSLSPVARARVAMLGAALTAITICHARQASACGGLFCNQGTGQAVDQTGENIVFFVDGKSVEAHIQIQYAGNAQRFAWVLPVPVKPDAIEIGSAPLITRLLNATGPTYTAFTTKACPTCAEAFPPSSGTDPFGGGGGSASGGGGTPVVVEKGTAGSFDYVVLQGGTADTLLTWLNENKFQQSPDALPILESYLAKGYLFVAVRLVNGAQVEDIHPIVVRYPGDTPCVPIRLTRIAAKENMKIRTFFLDVTANARWVPTNYKHVALNEFMIDPLTNGANYNAVLDQALDAPVVDGHGFVTESLGPKPFTPPISSPMWNTKALAAESASTIMTALQQQSFAQCSSGGFGQGGSGGAPPNGATCQFASPLVRSTLHDYLPPPMGVAEDDFYSCVSCFKDVLDASKWNGPAFAADIETRVVVPTMHAEKVLAASKHLTRMVTSLSPAEMTEDPDFHRINDATAVANFHTGVHFLGCDGGGDWFDSTVGKPRVALSATNQWPTWDASMPAAAKVEEFAVGASAPVTLVDNGAKIDAAVSSWNAQRNISMKTMQPVCGGSGGATGGKAGGSTAGGAPAAGGAPPAAGASMGTAGKPTGTAGAAAAPSGSADAVPPPEAEGGCSTSGTEAPLGLTAWLVALLFAGRARKRPARDSGGKPV